MNTEYFEKFSDMARKMQEPFQALTDLNVKTLQGMSYLKPQELISLKKPEELVEKQLELAIENGHKALDYLEKCFQIYEKAWFSLGVSKKMKIN